MKKITNNRKGQLSLEAGFILLIILFIIPVLWFSGPVQQSTEKMIDVNGVQALPVPLHVVVSNSGCCQKGR